MTEQKIRAKHKASAGISFRSSFHLEQCCIYLCVSLLPFKWVVVMTDLLGPKGRSECIGRISFLCYSSMMLQGLEWILRFKAIYRQRCRLWDTLMGMLASVTEGGTKVYSSSFLFTLLCARYCHLFSTMPLQ